MALHRRVFVCLLAGLGLAGCLSPTLPMPPPAPPDVQLVGQGQYQLSGSLPTNGAEATVLALDYRTGIVSGQIARPSYRFVVSAKPGDPMTLWYVSGLKASDYTDFRIPGTPPDGGAPPDGSRDASGN